MKHFGLLLILASAPVFAQDGQFDPTFGNAGYEGYDPVSFFPDRGMDIEVAPDGRVVFGGYVYGANNERRSLASGRSSISNGKAPERNLIRFGRDSLRMDGQPVAPAMTVFVRICTFEHQHQQDRGSSSS
jgi:hypothetical protein